MTRFAIRRGEARDAETIHAAIRAMAEGFGPPARITASIDDLRRHGFGDRPAFATLIAESEGRFAGLCLFFPSFSTWRGERGVYVQDLFVAAEFRGQGVAEALLRHLASSAEGDGARYIRLSVAAGNDIARRFYTRMGLQHAEDEAIYVVRGDGFRALAREDEP